MFKVWGERAARRHVLHPDFGLLGRHADVDRDEQIAAVFGKLRADDGIRAVSLAEDFAILRGGLAHGVVEDAAAGGAAGRDSAARIEKSALVLLDGHAEIAGAGQAVGEQLARFQVEDAVLFLVLAAVADAVGEQLPVAPNAHEEHGGGFVLADIRGVDQHFVLAVEARAYADGATVFIRQAAAEEVAAMAFGGEAVSEEHTSELQS